MELLFVGLYSLAIALAASALAKPREMVGPAFIPAIGTASGLAFWAIATWLLKVPAFSWLSYDRGVIWVLLVFVVAAVSVSLALTLPRKRKAEDDELLDRLSHAGASVL
ncbi:hypothetical protein [Gulosibacter molinativorax]|uniref:Uncharacterized protein n=1 Tax=Gulosibacter molinativorax TaxID=256821 RepID=A0ABT7C5W7_9MICO|nr:hypothetical protein [Gulosibacter molinativorax]MDJ1370579.1 hypothetical protein [Gulosibacter molinativorax]QUY62005.1 Hypotetical protein [Gulosibacter molinativorax]